jgi:oligopeptide transport system substrate-binding protein
MATFLKIIFFTIIFVMFNNYAVASGIIHRGNNAEPASIDPHFITGVWENRIVGDMFMGLTTESVDGKIIPGLAESWSISEDGKTYIFKIRNAKWSDGKKITAHDFEFSFKRILAPKNASKYAFILYPIKNAEEINRAQKDVNSLGVKALNNSTLKITLKNITPFFLEQLAHYTSWAVPKHIVEKYGKNWTKKENIVVSGAFIVEDWKPQTNFKLKKNPYFWDSKNVKLDGVVYYPIENSNSELKRYRAGELHTTGTVPSGQFKYLKKTFGKSFRIAPYLAIYYYPVNYNKIKDIRVRKALSMAVNRDVITQKILGEGQKPAYSFVPTGINNYDAKTPQLPFATMSYTDAVLEAKKLMQEAGYNKSNPLEIELKYNTSDEQKKVAVAISAMWKQIGVKTKLFNQEAKVHYSQLKNSEFQVARASWIGDYNDPTTFTNLFLDNSYNYSRWIDNTLIANAEKADRIINLEERAKLLAKVEKSILDSYVTIPIYYYVSKHIVSDKVIGWKDNILNIHRSRWMDLK